MPDITMCVSTKCPKRKTCYRSEFSGTIPNTFQSFSDFYTEKKDCEDYWVINK